MTRSVATSGSFWTRESIIPTPKEDDARQALFRVVSKLGEGSSLTHWPDLTPVTVEWVSYRVQVDGNLVEHDVSASQAFHALTEEASGGPTILYVHGGSY